MINEVLDVMVGSPREGMTMLVVTHEMGFARKVAHRVVFMDEGRVVEQGPPDALLRPPRARADAALPVEDPRPLTGRGKGATRMTTPTRRMALTGWRTVHGAGRARTGLWPRPRSEKITRARAPSWWGRGQARRRSGFIDKQNNWGGFSVDLAKLVHANLEKKVGKPIKFELKESTPATRIPLLTSGAVDLIAGTMTITRARRDSLDFSAVFFVTGAQFLGEEGQPDPRESRASPASGSAPSRARLTRRRIREKYPQAQLGRVP